MFLQFLEELKLIGISSLSNLVEKNGGWPITMSSKEWYRRGYKKWQQVSNIMQDNLFDNGLYQIGVMVDDKKSDSNVIIVGILFIFRVIIYNLNI